MQRLALQEAVLDYLMIGVFLVFCIFRSDVSCPTLKLLALSVPKRLIPACESSHDAIFWYGKAIAHWKLLARFYQDGISCNGVVFLFGDISQIFPAACCLASALQISDH